MPQTAKPRLFRTFLAALASVSCLAMAPAHAQDAAAEQSAAIDEAATWDLTDFYPSKAAWEAELERLRAEIEGFDDAEGTLGTDAATLLAALDRQSAFSKDFLRAYTYASNIQATNLGDPEGQEMVGRMQSLGQAAGAASAFLVPEVVSLGEARIMGFIAAEPGLEKHALFLRDALREAEHVLSPESEELLSLLGTALASPEAARSVLANAEIEWPTITLSDGTEAVIDTAGYALYRQSSVRADRVAVFDAFWGKWKQYESTFGATLGGEVQANVALAKARNYDSTLQYFLSGDNIPEEVYRTLIKVTNDRIDVLHRYFRLRARMLGIEELAYHDIYPPLVESDATFPIDRTRDLTLAATRALGEEYTRKLAAAADDRWMHVYPQKGKRSGAYMSGAAYDVHPLILLNHQDDYDSASTYAHEWGHAMHKVFTNENQPYELSNFSIFTTEIAAIANEILLQEHMLEQAQSDEERLFYLGRALEAMRGTYYRQAMFSEFELAIHEAVERGEALTGARMTEIYGEILERYHGHDEGVLTISERDRMEWAYIPHFFYNFYVYQYATSIAGAAYFVDELKTGGEAARANYIDFLKAGGKDYPLEILREAGLDMTSPAPYNAVIDRMDRVMDEIEAILDAREGN